jgi:hypothetical protein
MTGIVSANVIVLSLLIGAGMAGTALEAESKPATVDSPKTGFVVHFDAISNVAEGRRLVEVAVEAGANVISVVPPAHVWENHSALNMLDAILAEIARRKLSVIFARLDASYPPDNHGERTNYLYDRILNAPGVLPNGAVTVEQFLTTAGRDNYNNWMEEEIRFYAKRYGRLPNLLGINVGPFSEPFTAQRCGFLQYVDETARYELTQYTPFAAKLWHAWLHAHFGNRGRVNQEYGVSFSSLAKVPLPRNETDPRFGKPQLAYFDFIRALNEWFEDRYERCRRIWHEVSGRADVPLILQFSGFELEKFVIGRPSYAAFDVVGWVTRADAVGLSLYTNSGYDDFGHSAVRAMVNFLALAKDLGKDVFVLESGSEAPNVILDHKELEFIGVAALKLHPRTFIYEWLKDEFNEPYPTNPGKVIARNGEIRQEAFHALRDLFARVQSANARPDIPEFYALSDPIAARDNLHIGEVSAALYDLAADISIRWVPKGVNIALRAGVPIIVPEGVVSPTNDRFSALLASIPRADTKERERWRQEVMRLLRPGTAE